MEIIILKLNPQHTSNMYVISQHGGQSIKNHGDSWMVLSKISCLIRLINHRQYLIKPKTI